MATSWFNPCRAIHAFRKRIFHTSQSDRRSPEAPGAVASSGLYRRRPSRIRNRKLASPPSASTSASAQVTFALRSASRHSERWVRSRKFSNSSRRSSGRSSLDAPGRHGRTAYPSPVHSTVCSSMAASSASCTASMSSNWCATSTSAATGFSLRRAASNTRSITPNGEPCRWVARSCSTCSGVRPSASAFVLRKA